MNMISEDSRLIVSTKQNGSEKCRDDCKHLRLILENTEDSQISDNIHTQRRWTSPGLLKLLSISGILYNMLLCGLLMGGRSVVYVELTKTYGITRTQASALSTVYILMSTCTNIVNIFFIRKLGFGLCLIAGSALASVGCLVSVFTTTATQIIVSIGVIAAYGHSYLFSCSLMTAPYLIKSEKLRNALTTILMAVYGFGGAVGSAIMSLFVDSFGLDIGMAIFTGCALLSFIGNVCVLILFRKRDGMEVSERESTQGSCSVMASLFRNKIYAIFFLLSVLPLSYYLSGMLFLVDHGYTLGFSLETAALFNSAFLVGSVIGRLINGVVFSFKRWRGINQYCFTNISLGLFVTLLSTTDTFGGTVAISLFSGITSGMLSTLYYLLPYELVDKDQYSTAIGVGTALIGVCNIVVSPIAGLIRDTYGSYEPLFISALPVCGLSSGLVLHSIYGRITAETGYQREATKRHCWTILAQKRRKWKIVYEPDVGNQNTAMDIWSIMSSGT